MCPLASCCYSHVLQQNVEPMQCSPKHPVMHYKPSRMSSQAFETKRYLMNRSSQPQFSVDGAADRSAVLQV